MADNYDAYKMQQQWATDPRMNKLKQYMDLFNNSGSGWGARTPGGDYSFAERMLKAEDENSYRDKALTAQSQPMPDFYGKQGTTLNIPAYQAPQYRQSAPMPQYQGGNMNMLLEMLKNRGTQSPFGRPQENFRQG